MNKCCFQVRVQPNARRSCWVGMWNGTYYKIALRAPAVDGKANEALIEFLSDVLDVPKSHISIVSGEMSRCKKIEIAGVSSLDLPKF